MRAEGLTVGAGDGCEEHVVDRAEVRTRREQRRRRELLRVGARLGERATAEDGGSITRNRFASSNCRVPPATGVGKDGGGGGRGGRARWTLTKREEAATTML
jgi:hypothetical protein